MTRAETRSHVGLFGFPWFLEKAHEKRNHYGHLFTHQLVGQVKSVSVVSVAETIKKDFGPTTLFEC